MYATLYDLFLDLFGIDLPFLQIANTFGFFVALAFLITSYVMGLELKRKEKEGLISGYSELRKFGENYPVQEYAISALFGFILGFKVLYLIFSPQNMGNPQDFILSMEGSWLWGIILAAGAVYLKYREDMKQRLAEPIEKQVTVHPYQQMGGITMIALLAGLLGAKLFHNLENWSTFIKDPIGELVSFSGLTFYGGLILGGIGVLWFAKKKGIQVLHMLDVGAPTMMLAYCLGRIGCQMSGDGDWGIVNTNPKPGWLNWAPDWIWAYDYPNNVNNAGVIMENCERSNCYHLDPMVYPTPLYEIAMAGLLFIFLWNIRTKVRIPGVLFGIYMIVNGIERFFIEKIRVNTTYDIGFKITQAEIISSLSILGGIAMILILRNKAKNEPQMAKTIVSEEEE